MNTIMKLSLIALIAAIICPACTESEAVDPGANRVEAGNGQEAAPAETSSPKTLDDAIALAKAEGKNVLVEYTSTKCPFCRQMNSQTLAKADVKAALANKVVYFRAVKEKNPEEFTKKFGTQPTPSFLVLSGEGETLHGPVSGAIPTANFKAYLNWAEKGTGPVPSLSPGSS